MESAALFNGDDWKQVPLDVGHLAIVILPDLPLLAARLL